MVRTRVKVCGITSPQDGLAAVRAGVDAIGLVFYPRSSRVVSLEEARAIAQALPPFVSVVGLFLDAQMSEVQATLARVPLDLLQFHGREPPEYCRSAGRPYLKAVSMAGAIGVSDQIAQHHQARGFLLDSHELGQAGGTGTAFDWTRVPKGLEVSLVLAGGLSPDNVAEAIRCVRPYAVDVSSGVESGKGVKDAGKMLRFVEGVKLGDTSRN
jgi:phosphoribosylanthranilate isomerase